MGKRRVVAVVVVAALVLVGCRERIRTYDGAKGGAVQVEVLTANGSSTYSFSSTQGAMTVVPVAGTDGPSLRSVFVPKGVPTSADQESCATWSKATGEFTQLGAALRVHRSGSSTRAITVTQNVYGWRWIFNVHVWDTAAKTPMQLVAHLDFSKAVGSAPTPPLRLCARVIGRVVDVKLWPGGHSEPTWSDHTHVASAMLPSGWTAAGSAGWFIGHLEPGDQATFSNLSTWDYRLTATPT